MLVEAAVEAGVEVRTGFAVEEFTTDGDRITGIRGRAKSGGAPIAESATVVVGADGRHSRLARCVGAEKYNVVPPLTCWYFSYWSGVGDTGIEIYFRPDTAVFAFPTNDSLIGDLRRLADSAAFGGPRGHRGALHGRGGRDPGVVRTRARRQA